MTGRGVHHVTAIATDAARNLDFYTRVLGLRLVKRTVTHEDPGALHLIYGEADGSPGGSMSFFSWTSARPDARRVSEAEHIGFAVPPAAIGWWEARFEQGGVPCRRVISPCGHSALRFEDPDGTQLALVARERPQRTPRPSLDIPQDVAISGLLGVTLSTEATRPMADLLQEIMGFVDVSHDGNTIVLAAHDGVGGQLCLNRRRGLPRTRVGAGSIHHVAFRARDEDDLIAMAARLADQFGIIASPVKDRSYFRSLYFRGPDGLLIEISTDGPGFLLDETPEELGTRLIFPPGLEDRTQELLRILPPLD